MGASTSSDRRPGSVTATIAVLGFLGVTALGGGIEMVLFRHGNTYLPVDMLDGVPLVDSFLVPGLVLGGVFGVGSLLAAVAVRRRRQVPALAWLEAATGRHWAWWATVAIGVGFALWMALEWVWLGTPWDVDTTDEAVTTWVLYGVYDAVAVALLVLPHTRSMRTHLAVPDRHVQRVAARPHATDGPPRVLVAHAGRHGATAGLAEMIAEQLLVHGCLVDVVPARQVRGVGTYDAVVIGGALYRGRWHRDALDLVRRHRAALAARPVWLFSSGPLDDSAARHTIPPVPQVDRAMRRIGARGHMTFGGALAEDAAGLVASAMARERAGDYRDPTHVAGWATHVGTAVTWEHDRRRATPAGPGGL